jgi:hypothetical protein
MAAEPAPEEAKVDRDDVTERYRRFREIGKQHNQGALRLASRPAVRDYARQIGIAVGKALVTEHMDELALAFDLAVYGAKPDRSRAIDRYAKAAGLASGSDEAVMLEAMRGAHFAVCRILRRHEVVGLVIEDIARQREMWLVDEHLEKVGQEGVAFAARVCRPEPFAMTCGVIVPVSGEIMDEVLAGTVTHIRGAPTEVLDDPRFAVGIYRAVLERRQFARAQEGG